MLDTDLGSKHWDYTLGEVFLLPSVAPGNASAVLVCVAVGLVTSPAFESASASAIGAVLELGLVDAVEFFDLHFGSH